MYYSVKIDDRTNWEWRALFIKDDHNEYILHALDNDEALTLSDCKDGIQ
jgi:hypothetical protein